MKLKEYIKLGIGELVVSKKKRAKVIEKTPDLVQIQYLKSGFNVWKRPRQIRKLFPTED